MHEELSFEIAGGKYEPDGEVNYKYINSTDSAAEAMSMFALVDGYPFCYLRAISHSRGVRREVTLLGDETEAELITARMRMSVASLWMTVTGARFVDIAADPEEQLAVVEKYIRTMKKGK